MHVYWQRGELTAAEARAQLGAQGRDLAYTTVATLVRILCDKGFLQQTNDQRPFRFLPLRTFDEVSQSLVGELIERVFGGSRERLMIKLFDAKRLTRRERALLEEVLREQAK
jgi:predicted transcriptional regulator